jgi:uncharacterized protein (DUF1015 family)
VNQGKSMANLLPFTAIRPEPSLAERVIAPPYDVLSRKEATDIALERLSFVRVTRSEVDLPLEADSHSEEAYQMARTNLNDLIHSGALIQDDDPHYYFYGQQMGEHFQLGLIAAASVDEYDNDLIKKHEFTRPDKEDDRTHHMEVIDVQVGMVFLTYRQTDELGAIFKTILEGPLLWKVTTDDDVEHTFYRAPLTMNDRIMRAFAHVPALYIADGHHRCAAASRVHANRKSQQSAHFLAGIYPDDALKVMAYNRVVHDLNGHTPERFLTAIKEKFSITDCADPVPLVGGTFTFYMEGKWRTLTPKEGVVDHNDPVGRLDVAVLQDNILSPILGITDPRRSTRIDFVGGIRGHEALSRAVDDGRALAIHCYPTPLDQLFSVADAGEVMPPKSTWFEPKLREGVAIRKL